MNKYMDHTHPQAFLDWPKRDPSSSGEVVCPKCKGHGGWNLQLNAYPLWDKEDTAENRHTFAHFRSMCGMCNGWGWGAAESFVCDHNWTFEQNLGKCYNRYRCTHCNVRQDVDSSD